MLWLSTSPASRSSWQAQIYEFASAIAEWIRHADLVAAVQGQKGVFYECQRSLEGIEHAKLDLDAQANARAQGYGCP